MTRHSSVEELSIYLDDRLAEPELRRLESHLAECEDCRRRLEGMRRVVRGLERLERTAPPPQLTHQVEQQVRFEVGRERFLDKVERRLGVMTAQPSILPIFALVVALAAIVYLFAYGLERHQQRGVPVILEPPPASRQIEDRVFEYRGGAWRQVGSEGADPTRVLDLTTEEGFAEWSQRYPTLELLDDQLEGSVVVSLDGDWVEVILPVRSSPD